MSLFLQKCRAYAEETLNLPTESGPHKFLSYLVFLRHSENFRHITEYITQQFSFPKKARFGPDGIFHEKDIFSEKIGPYDKTFWGNYNVIKPDEDLSKAIRESTKEE